METSHRTPTIDPYEGRFGKALQLLRMEAGLTIRELGNRAGVNKATIVRLEGGQIAEPRAETLKALAPALGVDADLLVNIVWATNGAGPGLPGLPTYLRLKYQLPNEKIIEVLEAIKHIMPPV